MYVKKKEAPAWAKSGTIMARLLLVADKRPRDVYVALGWTPQRLHEYFKPGRSINRKYYGILMGALGLSATKFFNVLRDYWLDHPDHD